MASPLGAVNGSSQKGLLGGGLSGSGVSPAERPLPAHSLSTASQDGSAASEQPPEKRLRLDPARLAYEKQLRRQAAALLDAQTQITRLQAKLNVSLDNRIHRLGAHLYYFIKFC